MKPTSLEPFVPIAKPELGTLIAAHPFLKGMKSRHMQCMAEVSMLCEFKKGEVIFREGEVANRFYLICKGNVALQSAKRDQEPKIIQFVGAGDVLGWSWLFAPYYWRFDAVCMEDTLAIFFYGTRLRDQAEKDPALGYDLMKRTAQVVIQRLQATRKQLLECEETSGPCRGCSK